jgi:hypothetical protein
LRAKLLSVINGRVALAVFMKKYVGVLGGTNEIYRSYEFID